ncbi:MAG: hypothetical protein WCF33_16695 [Pseudonocardiaceae bacterium]
MSAQALVLGMVDTHTGYRHLVAVEVIPLHRRSGRYPALCGAVVITGANPTVSTQDCQNCIIHAEGRPRRLAWAAFLARAKARWHNTD